MRGIVNTLPFKLSSVLLVLLVLFFVSRINVVPSNAGSIVVSLWERFHKRKLDYSKNLKAGFGENCQAHDNDDESQEQLLFMIQKLGTARGFCLI